MLPVTTPSNPGTVPVLRAKPSGEPEPVADRSPREVGDRRARQGEEHGREAESLGKAHRRDGLLAPAGRTPIVAVGTTDMHAQTQLHQEGPRDKVVTTVDVGLWGAPTSADRVPDPCGVSDPAAKKLEGWIFADLNTLAREANEEALATDGRPSCAIVLDRLEAEPLGGLLYLLMASVAYEGELLNVNAYDQPGVEAYKKIMKAKLAKK